MALVIVGIERKTGDWEMNGKSGTYDNILLHCSDETVADGLYGVRVKQIKIKTSLLDTDLTVGDSIKVYYDEYRKPESISIV